jgi:hypothetical protein
MYQLTYFSGGLYSRLTSDATGTINAIENGVQYLASTLKIFCSSDPCGYFHSVTPNSYTGVSEYQVATFNVSIGAIR